MCGICGVITNKRITEESLVKMNRTMRHRGPDDSGETIFSYNESCIGLAQCRLAIQDLSPLGHQPMCSADGAVWLVFNGEIYNFKELRKMTPDYPFHSACDTEVILAMYQKYGIRCLEYFNGMFAIALFDLKSGTLYLVRDRMGQKPLYYYDDGSQFLFASEIKPFLAYENFPGELEDTVIKSYLFRGYIEGPKSIFRNVRKVEPGTYLKYCGSEIQIVRYWDLAERLHSLIRRPVGNYQEAKELLKEKLEQAVAYRLIADVPVGSFLSGGYDSSLVTAIAQKKSPIPIRTYSIGFPDQKYDEAPFAKKIARYLGTDHTEAYMTDKDLLRMLDGLEKYYDEPFGDSSQLPSMLVAELASKDVKVALSGDGGDELFCGYSHYRIFKKLQRLRPVIEAAAPVLTSSLLYDSQLFKRLPESVRGIMENRSRTFKVQFLHQDRRRACDLLVHGGPEPFLEREKELDWISDWQLRRMVLEMLTYLPDDILCKVDRATMKYSLEARSPLLDAAVVETSFSIPSLWKYKDGKGKYILRDLAYDYIPKELLERPKRGFSVPLARWLRGPLREELLSYISRDYIMRQGILCYEQTDRLVRWFLSAKEDRTDRYAGLVWHLYVLQKWYEEYRGKRNLWKS